MNFTDYRDAVVALRADEGPFLTASLDLSLGPDSRGLAPVVFRQALADALANAGREECDLASRLASSVERAIDHASGGKAGGLYLVGARGVVAVLESPVPFRNHVRLGCLPWVFELERQTFLHSCPVLAIEVTWSGVRLVRIDGIGVSEVMRVGRDEHATQQVHGRAAVEGRSGATYGSGGHSRNRIERIVEERRASAAREAASEVEALRRPGDVLLIAGTPEPKAELLAHLSAGAIGAVVEPHLNSLPAELRDLVLLAAEVAARVQCERANSAAARIIGGAAGEQIARGLVSIQGALRDRRVSQLVVHEDVVACWGNATDARQQHPGWDDEPYETSIRAARDSSAEVIFSSDQSLMDRYQGIVAATRW